MNCKPGIYLKLYVHENRRHGRKLVYEWLLEQARKLGIEGGSAFRAIAGFGAHGALHEEHFFELQGDLPIEVVFSVTDEQAGQLMDLLDKENLRLFFIKMPVEYGVTGSTAG